MTNRFRMTHNSNKHAMWTVPLLFTPMVVFWVVTSCGLAGRYHTLGEHALKMEVASFSEALCLIHHNSELNRHWGWFLRFHSVYLHSLHHWLLFLWQSSTVRNIWQVTFKEVSCFYNVSGALLSFRDIIPESVHIKRIKSQIMHIFVNCTQFY